MVGANHAQRPAVRRGPPGLRRRQQQGRRIDGRRNRLARRMGVDPTPPRDVNQPQQWKKYHAVLLELMDHVHGKVITEGEVPVDNGYHKDKIFSAEELSILTPWHIYTFFAKKAYGREDPGVEDNPTEGRSSTLQYYKKAISFFMPNKAGNWTILSGVTTGNPTRSQEVNISLVLLLRRKHEA